MLFARAYDAPFWDRPRARIWDYVKENLRGPTSLWIGSQVEGLPLLPTENLGTAAEEDLAAIRTGRKPTQRDKCFGLPRQILPGLCAFACAACFNELAKKIWENYFDRESSKGGYARWCEGDGVLVVFEGKLVGFDPDGNSLFHPEEVLLITDVHAIRREI